MNNYKRESFNVRELLLYGVLVSLLLLANVSGARGIIYSFLDTTLNPFLIVTRNFGQQTSNLFKEMNNKSNLLEENIMLKRELLNRDQIDVHNQELQEQIKKLQAQTNIQDIDSKVLQSIRVIGVQKMFTANPEVIIEGNSDFLKRENQNIYYDKNVLFGFANIVEGGSVKALPFYSPSLGFKVPIKNLKDESQRGFISMGENGEVHIKNVPKDYKVEIGDIWVTTNDVSEVQPNLIVGKVKSVDQNQQDGFQDITLELPFNISSLQYLLIEK